jgi:N-terminal region of Chorein or VPS13
MNLIYQLKLSLAGLVTLKHIHFKHRKSYFCVLFSGKLVLKIPLTNLYKAPWIVCIERVFLLSVPNEEVGYDAEKEERLVQEAKQKEIAKVEEAKRLEALLGILF